ncbi:MAG: 4Fe-4S binding protein [Candidatus Oxydemutatoraceae bacterium WSBS_2016_MAG_OTU14]
MADISKSNDPVSKALGSAPQADPTMYSRHVVIRHATIKSIKKLTYDTFELVVKCTDDDQESLKGIAGQYATLKPEHLNKPRAYSFARAPECEKPGEHTFFIRLLHSGMFSGWLFEKDRVGEALTISGPLGKFRLDDSNKDMLCVAGGSGMSAIYAILEHAVEQQVQRDAYFFYGARTQKDLYALNEIKNFIRHWHPNHKLKFIPVLSEEDSEDDKKWTGATGFVTEYVHKEYIDSGVIDVGSAVAYFCGPPPMIDMGIDMLKKAGMHDNDIRYDKFEDARSPAPVIDNSMCVLCDECLMVKPVENCIVEIAGLNHDNVYQKLTPSKTSGLYYNTLFIDEKECIRCYACVDACPAGAINPTYDKQPQTLRKLVSNG